MKDLIVRQDNPQIPLSIDSIPILSDEDLYSIAESTGKWELLEDERLMYGQEDYLTEQATYLRCMMYMTKNGLVHDLMDFELKYPELRLDQERKLPYVTERVENLNRLGLLTRFDMETYRPISSKFDIFREEVDLTEEMLNLHDILTILLGDIDRFDNPRKEAERYNRLANQSRDKHGSKNAIHSLREILAISRSLTAEEIRKYQTNDNYYDRYFQARLAWIPHDMALTYEDSSAHPDPNENHIFKIAKKAIQEPIGMKLAIRDFGAGNLYQYLEYEEKANRATDMMSTCDSIARHVAAQQYVYGDVWSQMEAAAQLEEKHKENLAAAAGLFRNWIGQGNDKERFRELVLSIACEPLLRDMMHYNVSLPVYSRIIHEMRS